MEVLTPNQTQTLPAYLGLSKEALEKVSGHRHSERRNSSLTLITQVNLQYSDALTAKVLPISHGSESPCTVHAFSNGFGYIFYTAAPPDELIFTGERERIADSLPLAVLPREFIVMSLFRQRFCQKRRG